MKNIIIILFFFIWSDLFSQTIYPIEFEDYSAKWSVISCGTICCHRTKRFCYGHKGHLTESIPIFVQDEDYGACGENPTDNGCERGSGDLQTVVTNCETHECGKIEEDWF